MPTFTKLQKLKENNQGTSINKNSIVKFKTYEQNDQTGLMHSIYMNRNQISPQLAPLLLESKEGDKLELQVKNQNENTKKIVLEILQVKEGQQFKQNYVKAQILKNKGNQFIKAKNYEQAASLYSQGLKLIQYDCSTQCENVKISLLSNLSLAYLNTKKYEQCIKMCDQYLELSLQPNKKIIYRKATANKNIKKWDQAQNDIKFGLQICQNDEQGKKDFQILHEALKKQKKIQSQKQKKVYSKMFG